MTAPVPPADPETLLTHDAFVRGLARQLVRDPELADDAAQATWLATVSQGRGQDGPGLRGFLATVLRRWIGKHRRGERREAARRDALAAPPAVPSPAEILQREAQRSEVVQLVLALEPAQRDVVVLRFFEQLPPRAIAARLGVPVETVRTRLKRALAALRRQLDERHGERGAWVLPLLPFADAPDAPAWPQWLGDGVLSGGIGVSTQKALVAVVAVAVVATGFWLAVPGLDGAPAAPESGARAAPLGGELGAAAAPSASGDGAIEPAAAAPAVAREAALASDTGTGTLLVRVTFQGRGGPVADCAVMLRREGFGVGERPIARTDAAGRVRFPGLEPGDVYPVILRGGSSWGEAVRVVAGALVECELQLEPGMDVRGLVVDGRERPVPGAEVLVADWGGSDANVLAVTAADGTFEVDAVARHCHIGARAAGYAASPLRQFTAGEGARVELRIVLDTPACELHGVVRDPRGQPVAGAAVRVGSTDQRHAALPDGAQAMGWRPEVVTSDALGRFRCRHLPAGSVPVAVRARGLAPWLDTIELLAGPPRELTVVLANGVRVEGTVRDAAGAPVAGAEVRVGDGDEFTTSQTRSEPDGSYRLDAVAAGELALQAKARTAGKASAVLQGNDGQTIAWQPVLTAGLEITGRVVDAAGKPVAKVMIEGQLDGGRRESREPWWGFENTDDDGRFTLRNVPAGGTVRLSLRRRSTFPELVLPGIAAGARDVVVELPAEGWIHVAGSVLDPDGKPLANVHVMPMLVGSFSGAPAETADPATGVVRLGPYPPGEYLLRISAAGLPTIQVQRRVEPGATWDLGELRFERGGDVVVALVAADDAMLAGASASVQRVGGDDGNDGGDLAIAAGRGRLGPLRPGDYVLRVRSPASVPTAMPFTIVAGRETRLDVPMRTGCQTAITVAAPEDVRDGWVQVEVFADDALLTMWHGAGGEREVRADFVLDPGRYRVRALYGEFVGEAVLEVVAGAAASVRLPLRAK